VGHDRGVAWLQQYCSDAFKSLHPAKGQQNCAFYEKQHALPIKLGSYASLSCA